MRTQAKIPTLAVLALLLGACASTPGPKNIATQVNPAETAGVKADLLRAGFKPFEYGKQIYYCREEQVTGTQFKHQLCFNEQQMREQARDTQQVQRDMTRQRTNPPCPKTGTNAC
jgi:hypothetical protein